MSFDLTVQNEMALLGSMMLNKTAANMCMDQLLPEMLVHDVHRDLFKVLVVLRSEGIAFDILIIAARCEQMSKAVPYNKWVDYINECCHFVQDAAFIQSYAGEIRTNWYKIRLKNLASRCDGMTFDQVIEETERLKHQAAVVSRVREGGLKIFQRKKNVRGVSSSIDIVNDESKIGGYPSGQCSVILARSGDGKSAFMIQEALHMIQLGHPVLYITVADLSGEDITDRLKQMVTGWSEMPKAPNHQQDYRQLCKELGQLPITVRDASADTHGRTAENICGRIERFAEAHKGGIMPVAFIDYFQELTTTRAKEFRSSYDRDLYISSELITVSKNTQIPIIIGSQITITDGQEKTKGGDFLNDRSGLTLRIKRFRDDAEKKGIDEQYRGLDRLGAIRINKSRFGEAWTSVFVQFGKDLKLKEL